MTRYDPFEKVINKNKITCVIYSNMNKFIFEYHQDTIKLEKYLNQRNSRKIPILR